MDQSIKVGSDSSIAAGAGVARGPELRTIPLDAARAEAALTAFRLSCPGLTRRNDISGLARAQDWVPVCDAAASWPAQDAQRFFATRFEAVQVSDGAAFATGYFEPEIAASRTRSSAYATPIYRRPNDLLEADLGLFSDEWQGKKIRGKVDGTRFVLYEDRAAIEQGALAGRGLELAWAADPIELFFLQVQGSGRLRLPDGSIMRIGYESQNGRDYTGIGRLLLDRGLVPSGQADMQGIVNWLRTNPEQGRAIMRENKSYVFFREVTGPGPLGAMGYQVTGQTSVAADPRFVPLGAPVILNMAHDVADGIWVAQDTGGAIKGANRFDTFWGAGAEARRVAGGMASRGQALILLPIGSFDRLAAAAGR
ncbi:MAG: murein transglycosylase A [Parasphingorhabdus sp.]|nr:murein transglycosylase A [Parasphingorhabdus sp.]